MKSLKLYFKNSCNCFLDRYCLIKVISYVDREKLDSYKNILNKFLFTNILMYNLKYNSDIIPIIKKYQTKVDILSFVGETWIDHDERSMCMFEMNLYTYMIIYNESNDFIELWKMRDTKSDKDFIKIKNLLKISNIFKNTPTNILSKIIITLKSIRKPDVEKGVYICISCVNDINVISNLFKLNSNSKSINAISINSSVQKKYKIEKEFNFSFANQPKITNLFNLSSSNIIYLSINYVNSSLFLVNLTSKTNIVRKIDIGFNTNINYNFIIYINNIVHIIMFAKYVIVVYNIKEDKNYKIFGDYRTNYINGRISNNKLYCVSKCGTGINNNKLISNTQIYDWNSQKLIKIIQGLFRLDYYSLFINWKSNLKTKTSSYLLVCDNNLNNEIRVYDTHEDKFIWIINSIKNTSNTQEMDDEIQFNDDYSSVRGERDGEILYVYQSNDLSSMFLVYCENKILQKYKVKRIDFSL